MASSMFPYDYYPADTTLFGAGDVDDMQSRIIAFCAEEVRRQGDTPWHVFRMYKAWQFAMSQWQSGHAVHWESPEDDDYIPVFTPMLIRQFGKEIDELNEIGFRTTRIFISQPDGGHDEKDRPEVIDSHIARLCENQKEPKFTPIRIYAEFEEIHPFGDGNGRVGKILYNWANGTLDNPVWPENLFGGISNP